MLNFIGNLFKTVMVLAIVVIVLAVIGVIVISRMSVLDMMNFKMHLFGIQWKLAEFVNVMGL